MFNTKKPITLCISIHNFMFCKLSPSISLVKNLTYRAFKVEALYQTYLPLHITLPRELVIYEK